MTGEVPPLYEPSILRPAAGPCSILYLVETLTRHYFRSSNVKAQKHRAGRKKHPRIRASEPTLIQRLRNWIPDNVMLLDDCAAVRESDHVFGATRTYDCWLIGIQGGLT